VPWEGGSAYYSVAQSGQKMTAAQAAGWSDPSFFPISTWRSDPIHASELASVGINVMQGPNFNPPLSQLSDVGITAIPMWGEWDAQAVGNNTVVGWMASDEPDMGLDHDSWISDVAAKRSADPNRFVMTNFGNGILQTFWWQGANQMETAVQAVDYAQADQYYYTSPGIRHNVVDPFATEGLTARDWPGPWGDGDYAQSAASYGWLIQRLRKLAGGANRPFGVFIETQMPFLQDNGREIITYERIGNVVWAAICNEARAISYFQHNGFYDNTTWPGGPTIDPNTGTTPQFDTYSLVYNYGVRAAVGAINATIHSLAPVLNTQSYVWDFGPADVTTMLKVTGGYAYLFTSMGFGKGSGSRTFLLPGGISGATAEVIGEDRTVPVNRHRIVDTFPVDGHHAYKIAL
jgi:hypothetical protein